MLLLSGRALGAPVTLQVRRSADTRSCARAGVIADRVNGRLHRNAVVASGSSDAVIRIEFSRSDDRLIARLGTESGNRIIEDTATQCDGLVDAVVLTLALFLAEEPRALPEGSPRSTEAARARPAPSVGAGVGLLSAPPLPVLVAGSFEGRVFLGRYVALDGAALVSGVGSVPYAEGRVDVSFLAGRAGLCAAFPVHERSGLFGSLCASAGVGRVRGQGRGYYRDRTASPIWLSAVGSASAEGRIAGPWVYWVSFEAWAALIRPKLTLTPRTTAFRTPALVPVGFLGLGVRFY